MFALKYLIRWLNTTVSVKRFNIGTFKKYVADENNQDKVEVKGGIKRYETLLFYLGCIITLPSVTATIQTSFIRVYLISIGIDIIFICLLLRKRMQFKTQPRYINQERTFNILLLSLLILLTMLALVLEASIGGVRMHF